MAQRLLTKTFSTSSLPSRHHRHHRRGQSPLSKKRRRSIPSTISLLKQSKNKIHFQSLGCPRNWVDSEVMLGLTLQAGYEPTSNCVEADYVVLNTCGFLKTARNESTSELERILREVKEDAKVVVTGCMVNLYKEEITKQYPRIHSVLGSGAVEKILDALAATDPHDDDDDDNDTDEIKMEVVDARRSYLENGDVPRAIVTPKHYAYVKIAEGCRKRCSFCVIPKIKGPLRSKPIRQVVKECRALLKSNDSLKELVLIAQDLGDYGKDIDVVDNDRVSDVNENKYKLQQQQQQQDRRKNGQLASLLHQILQNTQDHPNYWLRLMYLYPDEITNEIISVIQSDRRICRYIDMPIQHIHNDLLRKMRRKSTGEDIKRTITKLRNVLPDVHIRTSLMVGFPGETEEHFNELLNFVKEYKLDHVGVFMYSNEEMAASSRLDHQVSEEVKQERYDCIMRAQLEIVSERNARRVASKERLEVVVEGLHPERKDIVVGRYYGQCPDIDGQILITDFEELGGDGDDGRRWPNPGERYMVELTDYFDYDLIGRIVVDV